MLLDPITRVEHYLYEIIMGASPARDPITREEHYLSTILGVGDAPTPITRIEKYLAKIAGADVDTPTPVTRIEFFLAKKAGLDVEAPTPITRLEHYLAEWIEAAPSGYDVTVTGTLPLTLPHSLAAAIRSLVRTGAMTQTPAPTPDAPVYPVINNGTVQMVDPDLPAGYKRLLGLKLESARFVTDIILTGASTLRFSASGRSGNWIGAFSSSSADDNYSFYATTNSGGKYLRYDGETYNSSIVNDTRYDIAITPTGITGNRTPSTWVQADFACSEPLCIGAIAPTQTPGQEVSFYGSIFADDAEIIPVERESDGALGYFVNGAFLTDMADGTVTSLGYDTTHLVPRVVGDTEVLTVGENLFSQDSYLDAYCTAGGTITAHNSSRCFVMECKPNTEYRFIFDNSATSSPRCIINGFAAQPKIGMRSTQACYSSSNTSAMLHDTTFTTDADVHYLVMWLMYQKSDADAKAAVNNAILMETATAQTATVINLFAVGDYADSVDVVAGPKTRRVGCHVFDGTEAFSLSSGAFRTVALEDKAANTKVVCSHFDGDVVPTMAVSSMPDLSVKGYGPNEAIFFKYSAITTVADFKAFLADQYAQGKPVIAWYPLAEPVTESITPQALRTVDGTTVVSSSAGSVGVTVEYKASQQPVGLFAAPPTPQEDEIEEVVNNPATQEESEDDNNDSENP